MSYILKIGAEREKKGYVRYRTQLTLQHGMILIFKLAIFQNVIHPMIKTQTCL